MALEKSITKREAGVGAKQGWFWLESQQSGEMVDLMSPETFSEDSACPWMFSKGKMGGNIS